jgi:carbon-monoxide dehydrogenase large subunit
MSERFVGQAMPRVEDARILAGRGRFVDDVRLPRMAHAAFLRSAEPHGRIVRVAADAARRAPGVLAVFAGADIAELVEPLEAVAPPAGFAMPPFFPLATDKVRFVGDPIALVVAETRALAEDACELIDVEIEPLPGVGSAEQALAPDAPRLFEELDDNVTAKGTIDYGDVDAAFAEADRVIAHTFSSHRWTNVPMEGRGIVADYDPGPGDLTLHIPAQSPHNLKLLMARHLRVPLHRTRVLVGDMGGSFGLKYSLHREYVAVGAAAVALGRPVRWIEDRRENLLAAGQAREETFHVEAAVRFDGTLTGLKVKVVMDQGAYPNLPLPSAMFLNGLRVMLPGAYRLGGFRFEHVVVATNKATYVAFRGPWASESWVREVLVDLIARELDIDPLEIRRRNVIRADEQPTHMVTGPTHDRMTAHETLERAVERIDYDGFRAEQHRLREQGRYVGIGLATFIEPAPGPADYRDAIGSWWARETAEARIEPDGSLTVLTAQSPHGQSHETTLAQVAADELGVAFEDVRVVAGDTNVTPFSLLGTGGSRSATMASGATIDAVREVKRKAIEIAAHLLEASPDDLELIDGVIAVRGTPQASVPLAEVAAAAYLQVNRLPPDMSLGLIAKSEFSPDETGWTAATHCCVVEIDVETGQIAIVRYLVAEDCGTMINPGIVEGQIRGGVAHGISGVLLEHSAYDDAGRNLTPTLHEYLLPTAMDIPPIEIEHLELAPIGSVNFRGVGEGGAICAPPALTNAIADALRPFGATFTSLPITPDRVLDAILRSQEPCPTGRSLVPSSEQIAVHRGQR